VLDEYHRAGAEHALRQSEGPDHVVGDYAARVAEQFNPLSIVLFGSQALGTARRDSDVDLLVVMPFEGKGMRQAVQIRHALRPPFALDLIIRRPEEIDTRVERRDFFLQDVMDSGVVLYDRRNH